MISAVTLCIWFYLRARHAAVARGTETRAAASSELLDPLCADACLRIGVSFTFLPWIKDIDKPAAWTSMRSYVDQLEDCCGDYSEIRAPARRATSTRSP